MLAVGVAVYAVLWGLIAILSGIDGIPRSVLLINFMVSLLLVGGSRMLMRWLLPPQAQGEMEKYGLPFIVLDGFKDC